jgi:ribonucleoside-diphosphate reductase alpha chain
MIELLDTDARLGDIQQSDGAHVARDRQGKARQRLPHRRGAIALDIEHAGHRYRMHIGYFPDGTLGEVFLDAAKQNSTLDAFAADAAILVSLLLQNGVLPAEIGHALRRAPDGTAASLIGAVVDRLVEEGGAPQRLQNGGT